MLYRTAPGTQNESRGPLRSHLDPCGRRRRRRDVRHRVGAALDGPPGDRIGPARRSGSGPAAGRGGAGRRRPRPGQPGRRRAGRRVVGHPRQQPRGAGGAAGRRAGGEAQRDPAGHRLEPPDHRGGGHPRQDHDQLHAGAGAGGGRPRPLVHHRRRRQRDRHRRHVGHRRVVRGGGRRERPHLPVARPGGGRGDQRRVRPPRELPGLAGRPGRGLRAVPGLVPPPDRVRRRPGRVPAGRGRGRGHLRHRPPAPTSAWRTSR